MLPSMLCSVTLTLGLLVAASTAMFAPHNNPSYSQTYSGPQQPDYDGVDEEYYSDGSANQYYPLDSPRRPQAFQPRPWYPNNPPDGAPLNQAPQMGSPQYMWQPVARQPMQRPRTMSHHFHRQMNRQRWPTQRASMPHEFYPNRPRFAHRYSGQGYPSAPYIQPSVIQDPYHRSSSSVIQQPSEVYSGPSRADSQLTTTGRQRVAVQPQFNNGNNYNGIHDVGAYPAAPPSQLRTSSWVEHNNFENVSQRPMARDGLAVTSEFLEADLANMSQEMGDRLFTPNQMSVSHTHSLSSDNPTFVATPPSGSKQHPQTQEPQNHPSELDSILGMSFYDLLNLPPPQVDTSMFDQSAQQLSLNPDSIATSSNLAPQPLAAELHSGKKRTRSAKTAKTVSTRSSRRNRLDPAAKKAQPLHVAQLEEAEEYGTIPNRKVNVHDDNDARRNARGPVGNADNKHVPIADVSLDSAGYSHNSNRNWEQLGRPRGSGVRQAAGGANKADTPPTIASAESHPSDRPEFDLSINVNLQRYYQNQNTGSPPDLSMVMPQALKIMAVDQEQLESTDGLMQSLPPISGDPAATSTDSGSNSPAYATYRNTGLLYDAIARVPNAVIMYAYRRHPESPDSKGLIYSLAYHHAFPDDINRDLRDRWERVPYKTSMHLLGSSSYTAKYVIVDRKRTPITATSPAILNAFRFLLTNGAADRLDS